MNTPDNTFQSLQFVLLLELSEIENKDKQISLKIKYGKGHVRVQYAQSVTGRKRGGGSRRIATVSRVVTTRHESSLTVSTITPEVISRKGQAEVNFR